MKTMKRIYGVLLILAMSVALVGYDPTPSLAAMAENEVHHMCFGSDRHDNTESIGNAMKAMPESLEYVGLVGDMVGKGSKNKAPEFNTSVVYDEVFALGYERVQTKDAISILWASHDENNTDDAGIIFANGGTGSGVMKIGLNEDGSIGYYVYGIAFDDMEETEKAEASAKEFESWVDTVTDRSIPIIVCCHVPLHYARKDNEGGAIWTKALNYAATGKETTEADAVIRRDVVYIFGHNHTVETKKEFTGEFFIPRESEMEVGATENVWSRIYFTYTTGGYLNSNNAATLLSVDPANITLTKYQNNAVVDGLYDTSSYSSGIFANCYVTAGTNVIARVDTANLLTTPSAKAANPILVSTQNATVKYSAVKKKAQTIAISKVLTTRNNKGKLTYSKVSGKKKLTINKKTGKITVKKGLKKGTYTLKFKVIAAGNTWYKKATKTVKTKITVS